LAGRGERSKGVQELCGMVMSEAGVVDARGRPRGGALLWGAVAAWDDGRASCGGSSEVRGRAEERGRRAARGDVEEQQSSRGRERLD
jgi:hypothetical protein